MDFQKFGKFRRFFADFWPKSRQQIKGRWGPTIFVGHKKSSGQRRWPRRSLARNRWRPTIVGAIVGENVGENVGANSKKNFFKKNVQKNFFKKFSKNRWRRGQRSRQRSLATAPTIVGHGVGHGGQRFFENRRPTKIVGQDFWPGQRRANARSLAPLIC